MATIHPHPHKHSNGRRLDDSNRRTHNGFLWFLPIKTSFIPPKSSTERNTAFIPSVIGSTSKSLSLNTAFDWLASIKLSDSNPYDAIFSAITTTTTLHLPRASTIESIIRLYTIYISSCRTELTSVRLPRSRDLFSGARSVSPVDSRHLVCHGFTDYVNKIDFYDLIPIGFKRRNPLRIPMASGFEDFNNYGHLYKFAKGEFNHEILIFYNEVTHHRLRQWPNDQVGYTINDYFVLFVHLHQQFLMERSSSGQYFESNASKV